MIFLTLGNYQNTTTSGEVGWNASSQYINVTEDSGAVEDDSQPNDYSRTQYIKNSKAASMYFGFLLVFVTCAACGVFVYRDLVRRREDRQIAEKNLRRQRIHEAVQAKLAEMEGLEDNHSLTWYIENRRPTVHFADIIEISPEDSSTQSVSVMYSVKDNQTNQVKRVEFTLNDLLTVGRGPSAPPTRATSPTMSTIEEESIDELPSKPNERFKSRAIT